VRACVRSPGQATRRRDGWDTGRIYLFETTGDKAIGTIAAPVIRNSALAFSPDGALVAAGMIDSSILLFDVQAALDRSDPSVAPEPKGSRDNLSRGPASDPKAAVPDPIALLNAQIRDDPKDPSLHDERGWASMNKSDFDKALVDFDEAIRLDPKSARGFGNRGWAWTRKNDLERALADSNEGIRLEPTAAVGYNNRGELWSRKKDYEKALIDFAESIKLDPDNAHAYDSRAWLLATCPDGSFRDGARAVDSAIRACGLSEWMEASNIDTLAAAYAEHGEFDKAVQLQEEAIKLFADADQRKRGEERLSLYKEKKPYRTTE
jgi:tetratricopeptide (TPR) repeat protein